MADVHGQGHHPFSSPIEVCIQVKLNESSSLDGGKAKRKRYKVPRIEHGTVGTVGLLNISPGRMCFTNEFAHT